MDCRPHARLVGTPLPNVVLPPFETEENKTTGRLGKGQVLEEGVGGGAGRRQAVDREEWQGHGAVRHFWGSSHW